MDGSRLHIESNLVDINTLLNSVRELDAVMMLDKIHRVHLDANA